MNGRTLYRGTKYVRALSQSRTARPGMLGSGHGVGPCVEAEQIAQADRRPPRWFRAFAVLDRQPELVNLKQAFRRNRKPHWDDEYTTLHRAAERGRDDVVAYLIEKGADVNARGPLDWTPLHVAAQKGDLAVVKRLVKAGAKLGAKTAAVPERVGIQGAAPNAPQQARPAIPSRTPIEMAQEAKHPEVVAYLKAAAK